MFENSDIDKLTFEEIPLDRDCYLMSEIYMKEFDEALEKMLRGEECSPYKVGYVSQVSVRKINNASLELSWYPNTYTRFHEVSVTLPKDMVRTSLDCWKYDIKPYIFVDHEWLEHLHVREYSVFALVDAIGVKNAIRDNALSKEKLISLREKIDELAERHTDISFISFADSLILKSNWDVGYFHKGIKCSYSPEMLLHVIKEIDLIYQTILDLKIYAVLTQGSNEYFGESLLHISKTKNHVCLNSLGVPFAELLAIESAAKKAIKSGEHPPMQLYIDEQFYHSLKFKFEFEKSAKPKNAYVAIMKSHQPSYFYSTCDTLIANLDNKPDEN
ncbi:hypothetical protein [Noviherbaspirillum suwonense]|uniref:Uncharacterized protein n=1 Tax=Noviherbaspirillum suwonense TaxID=1224511 RepID=A0ABY1QX23_9BURK|nr:hypothetical protein [Noviherbaspirillum suwonense]RYZ89044.1 MAG: hypothetical protein EOP04_07890 [Pseudomonadota bacterium]SMP80196.1 hypothetical protein SAMN06295970_13440 [Noviherbaspirillum suwonense]